MKRLIRILAVAAAVLVTIVGVSLLVLFIRYPRVAAAPVLHVDRSAERVERGRYLANHVTVCIDCHSTRDFTYFSGPITPGTEGRGGELFDAKFGFPGTFYAANITPVGIGSWTDGEILRTITSGVTNTGRAMFPVMPYLAYSNLSEDDAEAIVAYIRTLAPIQGSYPAAHLDFPMNLIVRTIPKQYGPHAAPSKADHLAYGKYLTTIAACADCHTPQVKGAPVAGMDYAGGFAFALPSGGTVHSANITPDMATGIGNWSREAFISRFQYFRTNNEMTKVAPGTFNSIMPWTMYAGMTDDDLGAIYDYLRTVKPVSNNVKIF